MYTTHHNNVILRGLSKTLLSFGQDTTAV